MVAEDPGQGTIGPPPILVVDDDPEADIASASVLTGASGYPVAAEARGDVVLRLVRASLLRLVISETCIDAAVGRPVPASVLLREARPVDALRAT